MHNITKYLGTLSPFKRRLAPQNDQTQSNDSMTTPDELFECV